MITTNTNVLTGDFLTGFEAGIFLRGKKEEVEEYGCPKAKVNLEMFRKFKELLPAVATMMGVMNNDQEIKHMMEGLTVFVDHIDELVGVFDNSYTGGDFCAGLTFGQSGSNLLYQMASIIINENVKKYKQTKQNQEQIIKEILTTQEPEEVGDQKSKDEI